MDEPELRRPKPYKILEQVMVELSKLDYFNYFRIPYGRKPILIPDSFTANINSRCYLDCANTSPSISIVISNKKSDKPYKKLKLSYDVDDFLSIKSFKLEDDPIYVSNYLEYEECHLQSLDDLYFNVITNCYFSISQLKNDFVKLMLKKLKSARNIGEKKYINEFWNEASIRFKRYEKDLKILLKDEWKSLISDNPNPKVTGNWHRAPYKTREYKEISDYEPVAGGSTTDRLKTDKKGCCNGKHCSSLEALGPFDLVTGTWKTLNKDRLARTECSETCPCVKNGICMNRQISDHQEKQLWLDVVETPTWGFDTYTYRNIFVYLRVPFDPYSYCFIDKALPKAINSVKWNSWDIREALDLILKDTRGTFNLLDMKYAHGLLNAINALIGVYGADAVLNEFKIHPKGTGVVCINRAGIPANSLVVEYSGELYTPALWFEKQDALKNANNTMKRRANDAGECLPDFYNIMIERHMDDPAGYDVMVVDPILKGKYGSRLSHSCAPNCGTVTTVANGRYTIGMYALKPISYLEELTFDYNSFTESRDEHFSSICLCGSSYCRRYYLSLSKNSTNFHPSHNFVHRIGLILRSCYTPRSDKHIEICNKFSIKSALLDGCPDWLVVWVALVLEVVQEELNSKPNEIEKKIVLDSRIQNLAITIDKIKYCMSNSNDHPPMQLLSKKDALDYIWGNEEYSVKQSLMKLTHEFPGLNSLLGKANSLNQARKQLLKIRDLLRAHAPSRWIGAGIADILHLIAYTQLFFRDIPYASFESQEIHIRPGEISRNSKFDSEKLTKKYSPLHIQGIMAGWFKQSVEKPHASLSADKRGAITLSSLESLPEMEYNEELRGKLIKHLQEKPASPWPAKHSERYPWGTFVNSARVMGSPMFDTFHNDEEAITRCLKYLDVPAESCDIPPYYDLP
ncbi:unnamed protein product [Blepharisma stoltei]|uniref:SET domain-containing protein n=1 Tax=Blepharisma stoltei TaxID=1481888 RepID=A0AAU9KAH1_9CILI|nr:unnamed protein product [Blepharisma stoltei]